MILGLGQLQGQLHAALRSETVRAGRRSTAGSRASPFIPSTDQCLGQVPHTKGQQTSWKGLEDPGLGAGG